MYGREIFFLMYNRPLAQWMSHEMVLAEHSTSHEMALAPKPLFYKMEGRAMDGADASCRPNSLKGAYIFLKRE